MPKTLKILSRPRGNAEEYGRWSANPYLGCPHHCLYCYLKTGVWAKKLGVDKPVLKDGIVSPDHAYHLAMAEILEHQEQIVKDGGLFMSFTTDPMIPETQELFLRIASAAIQRSIPVTMLTKSTDVWNHELYYQMRSLRGYKQNIDFGWTLTGHDELEPNAPTNAARLRDMRIVKNEGFKVWASIEPVIDFPSALDMIAQALDAGCSHFKIGLLTKNTKVVRNGFNFGDYSFRPYDVAECMSFTGNVMELTQGRATVYWKRSFYDFFVNSSLFGMTAYEFLHQWSHSVDKDFSMFKQQEL